MSCKHPSIFLCDLPNIGPIATKGEINPKYVMGARKVLSGKFLRWPMCCGVDMRLYFGYSRSGGSTAYDDGGRKVVVQLKCVANLE